MTQSHVDPLVILSRFAPGTTMRAATELILRQRTGALVLLAEPDLDLDLVCSGGFHLRNAPFTAQRVAELAKMDGGIVVSSDFQRILRANVQFMPDPALATDETGTRFRTAERLAKQTKSPILAVSEEVLGVAVVYADGDRFELRDPSTLQADGNQNLISLERLRRRLEAAEDRLTRLEVDGVVTVRDVVLLLQRAALVRRMSFQIDRIVVELGGEANLISIQSADLMEGVNDVAAMVYEDYRRRRGTRTVFDRLGRIATEDLQDIHLVAEVLGLGELDAAIQPRGLRALSRVPHLPDRIKDALLKHFGSFERLLDADVEVLAQVDGVGTSRAEQLRSYLDRLLQHGTPFAIPD